jgi:hypothetical protein
LEDKMRRRDGKAPSYQPGRGFFYGRRGVEEMDSESGMGDADMDRQRKRLLRTAKVMQ